MTDGRLLKVVMLEALEVGCKVQWVKEQQQSLVRFGWKGLDAEAMSGLTMKDIKQVLGSGFMLHGCVRIAQVLLNDGPVDQTRSRRRESLSQDSRPWGD